MEQMGHAKLQITKLPESQRGLAPIPCISRLAIVDITSSMLSFASSR